MQRARKPQKRAPKEGSKSMLEEKKTTWSMQRSVVPLYPVSKRISLAYYEFALSVTTGVGTAGNYVFSANGCYDPNITGTGHQPMGFDQMMTLYDQYTVVGAKITVNFCSTTTVTCGAVYVNPLNVPETNIAKIVENGLVGAVHIDSGSTTGGTGQRVASVTKALNMAKYFGRPNIESIVNDPELHGTAAANPTEQVYFVVSAWDFILGGSATVYFDALLEFDVIFTEPRKLDPS